MSKPLYEYNFLYKFGEASFFFCNLISWGIRISSLLQNALGTNELTEK